MVNLLDIPNKEIAKQRQEYCDSLINWARESTKKEWLELTKEKPTESDYLRIITSGYAQVYLLGGLICDISSTAQKSYERFSNNDDNPLGLVIQKICRAIELKQLETTERVFSTIIPKYRHVSVLKTIEWLEAEGIPVSNNLKKYVSTLSAPKKENGIYTIIHPLMAAANAGLSPYTNDVTQANEKLNELEKYEGIFLSSPHPQAYRDLVHALRVAIADKQRIGVIGGTLEDRKFWVTKIQDSAEILKGWLHDAHNPATATDNNIRKHRKTGRKPAYKAQQIAIKLGELEVLPTCITKEMEREYGANRKTIKAAIEILIKQRSRENTE
jgi:hypothetical protein